MYVWYRIQKRTAVAAHRCYDIGEFLLLSGNKRDQDHKPFSDRLRFFFQVLVGDFFKVYRTTVTCKLFIYVAKGHLFIQHFFET
ncbi:hypothetical protein DKS90_25320, partial [Salmonella enterica subsp. enterica serovar Muenchen]|nr:hypothetical protein [Salmonella enterica subsp. enterica serovar Muenchen]